MEPIEPGSVRTSHARADGSVWHPTPASPPSSPCSQNPASSNTGDICEATGWTGEHTDEVMAAAVTLGFATPRRLGEWQLTPTFRTFAGAMALDALIRLLGNAPPGVKAA